MALQALPEGLENTSFEHCFHSCLGMTLAHHGMLGSLALQDIVRAISGPDEEITPPAPARALGWLVKEFDLRVKYMEKIGGADPDFVDSLEQAGVTVLDVAPTMDTVASLAGEGEALITQINYDRDEGKDDFNLNHVVYLGVNDRDNGVLLIDPDGPLFGVSDLAPLWGRFPNLISTSKK